VLLHITLAAGNGGPNEHPPNLSSLSTGMLTIGRYSRTKQKWFTQVLPKFRWIRTRSRTIVMNPAWFCPSFWSKIDSYVAVVLPPFSLLLLRLLVVEERRELLNYVLHAFYCLVFYLQMYLDLFSFTLVLERVHLLVSVFVPGLFLIPFLVRSSIVK
jgi:hypothetical protein